MSREFIMYVVADDKTDANDFVEKSMSDDLPFGMWKNHEEGDDFIDSDDHNYESTEITENDLTNQGLKRNTLVNASLILRDMEDEDKKK